MNAPRGSCIAAIVAVALCGCSNARYVMRSGETGIVAIPSNSSRWPTHHRKKAEELMRQQFPEGYVIVHEEEVVVGETITETQTGWGGPIGPPGRGGFAMGPVMTSAEVHPRTEWRITYRKALPDEIAIQSPPKSGNAVRLASDSRATTSGESHTDVRHASHLQSANEPNRIVPANGTGVLPSRR